MANHEMLLSLYQKRRGLRLLTFFDVEELVVAPEDGIGVFDLASKREPEVTINLKCLSLFFHIECSWLLCYSCVIRHFTFFWITVQVELISLEHCSSRNRKILRHIVHTLKFLAWLSRLIKHNAPKLVAQARLQQLWSDHDLSKVICVDVRNERIFNMYWHCRIVSEQGLRI